MTGPGPDKTKAAGWQASGRFLLPAAALVGAASLVTGIVADRWAIGLPQMLPDWVDPIARHVTSYGKSGWILVSAAVVGGSAWALGQRMVQTVTRALADRIAIEAAGLFVAVAGSGITANLLKRAIGRPRPSEFADAGLWGLHPFSGARFESFPSGHSTTAGALVASLVLIWPRLTLPLVLAGAAIALSRVLLAAHHPSDVVAGFGYGICWALWVRGLMLRRGLVPN